MEHPHDFHEDQELCQNPVFFVVTRCFRYMAYDFSHFGSLRHHWKHVDHCEGGSCHGDFMLLGYL